MNITVFHPSIPPHVRQTCMAIYENDSLNSLITTFVQDEDSIVQKSLINLLNIFHYDFESQLKRRSIQEIPLSKIKRYPYYEVIRTLASRWGFDPRLIDFIFDRSIKNFNYYVSKNLGSVDAIYGYEYCCLEAFKEAKKLGIKTIYEVPSPEHDFVSNILRIEFSKFPELETPYYKYTQKFQKIRTQRRKEEWELADLVIANSEFTKMSYENAGYDTSKLKVIPLGCPPVRSDSKKNKNNNKEKINFLWAGSFSVRKGAHYLLEAWKKINPRNARLNIFGAMILPKSMMKDLPDSIIISKTIPQKELYDIYTKTDALIFPTLCDGFGMVITEALAHGLPVITTNSAGASDLIDHMKNGFVIKTADVKSICEIIEWCLINPDKLLEMKENAINTARNWQWNDYRNELIRVLNDNISNVRI